MDVMERVVGEGGDPERRHRYLLRTADKAGLVRLHAEALQELGGQACQDLLDTLRHVTAAGRRIAPDDAYEVARLFVLTEKRRPGLALASVDERTRVRLAGAVLSRPGLGYLLALMDLDDGWDAEPPEPADEARPSELDPDPVRTREKRIENAHHRDYLGHSLFGIQPLPPL